MYRGCCTLWGSRFSALRSDWPARTPRSRRASSVFGAVSLEDKPRFHDRFEPVFNGDTFLLFLEQLVERSRRKLFLSLDNGPCHNLKDDGKQWLRRNRHRIELFRLHLTHRISTRPRCLEADQEAHDPQSVLPHHAGARRRAGPNLRDLQVHACPRRHFSQVMSPGFFDPGSMRTWVSCPGRR